MPHETAGLSAAIARGLAPDGGLYVPETLPSLELATLRRRERHRGRGRPSACDLLRTGDAMAPVLPDILRDAFNFPVPTVDVAAAHRARCRCSSCFTVRRRRSRTSARASSQQHLNVFHATTRGVSRSWSQRRVTPAGPSRLRFISAPGSTSSCCIRAGSCRRGRKSSSPAGATTCAHCRSPARSTIASAWSRKLSSIRN